jgi:acetyltransferase-like isoleucine patch superfamily enzyme
MPKDTQQNGPPSQDDKNILKFHDLSESERISAFKKYKLLSVGDKGYGHLALSEIIQLCLSSIPGALGIFLRQKTYPLLFKKMQRGVILGRNVFLRQAKKISIGSGSMVDDFCRLIVVGSEKAAITIGYNVLLGPFSVINSRDAHIALDDHTSIGSHCRIGSQTGGVRIGRYVMIGAYSYVGGGSHTFKDLDKPMLLQPFNSKGGVDIEDDVWLGSHVAVIDGVTIGKGSVIGAHSLVTKDVPPYSITYGVPARVHGSRVNGNSESSSE